MAAPLEILTVVGARPQLVKAAVLARCIAERYHGRLRQGILHTGQHYDPALSDVFFKELGLPTPDVSLGVGAASIPVQTARMVEGIADAIAGRRPDLVLVFGDTTSTLAGALAAAQCAVPVAHVEAGLRAHDRSMPEEINRIVADRLSTWLFCPTEASMTNLGAEGIRDSPGPAHGPDAPVVRLVGDILCDHVLGALPLAEARSQALRTLDLGPNGYLLATVHRAANSDDADRLSGIIAGLHQATLDTGLPVVLPLHPRVQHLLDSPSHAMVRERLNRSPELRVVPPQGPLDMLALTRNAAVVLTDSGGLQKEAAILRRPCVVLRDRTEWVELVASGRVVLADADPGRIAAAAKAGLGQQLAEPAGLYGDGDTAGRICSILLGER
ncbi:MAG: UDP-N-acetylglucosamine 2-epimerase (non-hydrolyzing) [Flavobacteriales bacterium]|nr:UDP-N-acetylglucosamine 2-epimerase (non-hydrolyzing) [Flavobacteriales bacterium]